jgi:hypothetical protein
MDVFQQIRAAYSDLERGDALTLGIERWKSRHPAFERIVDAGDLASIFAKGRRPDYERRDRILGALCIEARRDEIAKVLVCRVMLSGLLDVVRDLSEQTTIAIDELHAEILAHFWEAVCKVPSTNTVRVAQRLKNAAKFGTVRSLRQSGALLRREIPTEDHPAVARRVSLPADDQIDLLVREAVAADAVSKDDAELALSSPRKLSETASRMGVPFRAARARRQKAKANLRHWISQRSKGEQGS